MNIALMNPEGCEFYIAAVKRHANLDVFVALGKRVSKDGRLLATGQGFEFPDQRDAEGKVRDLVKVKIKRRGWTRVDLEALPKVVLRFLEVPPEMQVTPEELVLVLRRAQVERYVIFSNVSGLEEYFDAGVEYLGFETEDKNVIKVFDRYGALRECFVQRMKSVVPTERAVEAKVRKVGA